MANYDEYLLQRKRDVPADPPDSQSPCPRDIPRRIKVMINSPEELVSGLLY